MTSKQNKTDKQNKTEIYKKFQAKQDTEERRALRNKGIELMFGDADINITALPYDEANDLEDKLFLIIDKIQNLRELDTKNKNFTENLIKTLSNLLRDDLLELARLCTVNQESPVTYEFIQVTKATKNDIIKLIIESLKLNYSYIKNFLTLTQAIQSK
jgi:hypothetical protein